MVYTRHLFTPREGILIHQCNIAENIKKIKRIQRWNKDEDSTARNNWNAKVKKTNSRTPVGPTSTNRLTWKAGAVIGSEARSAGVQPKGEATLLTVIGLTTMHAVCRITFLLYPIFIYRRKMLRNCVLKSLQAYIFFLYLYTKNVREKSKECHHHKPQPFQDTKRKRKQTKSNKHKSNKRTKTLDRPCCKSDLSLTLNFETKSNDVYKIRKGHAEFMILRYTL